MFRTQDDFFYGKFKISVHSIPTKKTHDETGHSHSETVPY